MKTTDALSLLSKIRQKANRRILTGLAQYNIEGLATSHGDILFALFHRERMTMAEIAGKIRRDKSTVTALVNKLIQLGYIKRERDPVDTRVYYVSLTDTGKALQPAFEAISREVMETFYQNISEEEKEILLKILMKIEGNL